MIRPLRRYHRGLIGVIIVTLTIAALWPLFAWRWTTGRTTPEEGNPHRVAALERRS